MSLRVVLHRKIPEDASLQRKWNDVALQVEDVEVFYSYEWAMAMQSAYSTSLKPLLCLGYEDENLVGVASLATDAAGKKLSFLAGTTADYCEFLSRPNLRAAFLAAVFAELGKMKLHSVELASIPEKSSTISGLRDAAAKNGFHVFLRPACLCAQVELGRGAPRQELKANLTSYRKFRRYIRAMEREGPVSFVHLHSQEDIHQALPAFTDAHVARFQEAQRTSFLSSPERRRFLEELAARFSGSGVVTMSMLKIADRPVAWNYGFQFEGSWFIYQATFETRQEQHSPGHCLLSQIVADACDMDTMKRIDLGVGAEGYKGRFRNSTRQTLYGTVTKSWRRHLQEVVRYRAAFALKKSPKLESAARRVLRRPPNSKAGTPAGKKDLD